MSDVQIPRPRLGRTEARDVILEAAARVFNMKGRTATVEDIAHEAGYSTSALYKHFSNKDDIFQTLWKLVSESLLDLYQTQPLVDLPFIEHLKWTLYRIAQFAEDERQILLAGMANTPGNGAICQVDSEILESYRTMEQAMVTLMERGIEEGILRPGDANRYELALSSYFRAVLARWAIFGPFPLKPEIDKMLEFFLLGSASDKVRAELLGER